jgi:hypothetical protein
MRLYHDFISNMVWGQLLTQNTRDGIIEFRIISHQLKRLVYGVILEQYMKRGTE